MRVVPVEDAVVEGLVVSVVLPLLLALVETLALALEEAEIVAVDVCDVEPVDVTVLVADVVTVEGTVAPQHPAHVRGHRSITR